MPRIRLNKVHCRLPDEIDKDEIYLKFNSNKIWPKGQFYHRVDTGDVAPIGVELDVAEGWNEVELWDFDFLSRNDFLGKFRFKVDETPGAYSNTMKLVEENSTASYVLDWEIFNREGKSVVDD
ncbi:MAG: hypothetical protein AAFQ94_29255 [Bacteroidota bacterium]